LRLIHFKGPPMKPLIFALVCLFTAAAPAQTIDPELVSQLRARARTDVLVYLGERQAVRFPEILKSVLLSRKDRISWVRDQLVTDAELLQAPLLGLLREKGIGHRAFYIENVVLVRDVDEELLSQLARTPHVRELRPDRQAALKLPPVIRGRSVDTGTPGHLAMIRVDQVWSELGVKGAGITVAGQDTGYFWEHDALKQQYRGYSASGTDHNYHWHDATDAKAARPIDDHSHGTHTMGTMVGFDGKDERIGVAPAAKWIGCRNMLKGVGKVSTYLGCFEFFLAPYPFGGDPQTSGRPDLAPHIVNNSWACPPKEGCKGDEFLVAVRALRAAGIFVVNVAGNEGPNCASVAEPPGSYAGELFTVGAYNRYTRDAASFSSRGPSAFNQGLAPNLVTPGDIIRSAVTGRANRYDDKAGTSMAAPQVAGVVALLWSAHPELIGQIERTTEILEKSAKPLTSSQSCGRFVGSQIPNAVMGYGMLDAYAALELARQR